MSRALLFWLAVLLMFGGAATVWFSTKNLRETSRVGSSSEPEDSQPRLAELTEFEFVDQLGKPFGSRDLEGKVWIGSFFFADCPSICVQQNNEIAKLHRRFRDQGLYILNISVAPDKDPPHKLQEYARRFGADHASWKFLTGKDIEYVRQVGIDIFQLAAADETHTTEVRVFDRQGQRWEKSFNVNSPEEFAELAALLDDLLSQSAETEGGESRELTEESEVGTQTAAIAESATQ